MASLAQQQQQDVKSLQSVCRQHYSYGVVYLHAGLSNSGRQVRRTTGKSHGSGGGGDMRNRMPDEGQGNDPAPPGQQMDYSSSTEPV